MKGCLSSSSKAATRRCLVMSGSQATSTKMQPSRSAFVTNAHPSSFWYFLIRSPLFFSFHSLYLIFLSFSSCLPSCRKNMQFSRWRKQILNCRQQQENPVWVHLSSQADLIGSINHPAPSANLPGFEAWYKVHVLFWYSLGKSMGKETVRQIAPHLTARVMGNTSQEKPALPCLGSQ